MMEFWVKLIKVKDAADQSARDCLQENCTHIKAHFWLFEGDEEALIERGIKFYIVDEQAIEAYGDMSSRKLRRYVKEIYGI